MGGGGRGQVGGGLGEITQHKGHVDNANKIPEVGAAGGIRGGGGGGGFESTIEGDSPGKDGRVVIGEAICQNSIQCSWMAIGRQKSYCTMAMRADVVVPLQSMNTIHLRVQWPISKSMLNFERNYVQRICLF